MVPRPCGTLTNNHQYLHIFRCRFFTVDSHQHCCKRPRPKYSKWEITGELFVPRLCTCWGVSTSQHIPGSAVIRLRAGRPGYRGSIAGRCRARSSVGHLQTGRGAQPVPDPWLRNALCPKIKLLECQTNNLHPSNAEVVKEWSCISIP
jgi:hypothetical protein